MSRKRPYHISRKINDAFHGAQGPIRSRPSEPERMAEIDDPRWAAFQEQQMWRQAGRHPEGTIRWRTSC